MTVICTKCGALSSHDCRCLSPVTFTGYNTPPPPSEPAKPELPVWVITCDRCGTTYKNNERHACPPPFTKPDRQACDYCDCGYKPENCKGCGPEPAKPERQASEIEKLAAMALLGNAKKELCQFAVFDKPERAVEELNIILERIGKILRDYNEAYDYAKTLGALNDKNTKPTRRGEYDR